MKSVHKMISAHTHVNTHSSRVCNPLQVDSSIN